jgi:hypothetical protein
MRPETFRKRLEVLHQRAANARPMAPVPVVLAALGESAGDALARAGVDPGRLHVLVRTVDASTPRPEATP